MISKRSLWAYFALILIALGGQWAEAVDVDGEVTLSGGSTENLFSDSTEAEDTYYKSTADLNWYPLSFARVNLVSEYSNYGSFTNLSNLVYGGGLTFIPFPDSSRLSLYAEGNLKKREYRDTDSDSTTLNANEFTGDEYDGRMGIGYDLSDKTQVRAGVAYKVTQYGIDGVIDREKLDLTAGANTTLFGWLGLDLEVGYTSGDYQKIDPITIVPGDPPVAAPRRTINPGEQYSILLTDQLKSCYLAPRLSGSIGHKIGLSLTYSYRQFLDRDEEAIVYGYSTGYLSPWLNEYDGQAVVFKVKTYLIPRLITTVSAGYWEREHIRTVESEYVRASFPPFPPYSYYWTVNLNYAQERTDQRRRLSVEIQWPLHLVRSVSIEPGVQLDYTNNNSTVKVYDYDNLAVNGGLTVRF